MPKLTTWLSQANLGYARISAERYFPKETGGILMGYWADVNNVVINNLTVSGPKSLHNRYSYTPDYEYDTREAAKIYRESNGLSTYLGDWHTHPNTEKPYLSFKDKVAMHRIANDREARAPRPLAIVWAGTSNIWRPLAWIGEEAVTALGYRFLVTVRSDLTIFAADPVGL